MNEDYWYYEEQHKGGIWLDAFTGLKMNREDAIAWMQTRKAQHPRAKLRLVHVTRERFSYRNRKAAK